jgi:hypothetical protein
VRSVTSCEGWILIKHCRWLDRPVVWAGKADIREGRENDARVNTADLLYVALQGEVFRVEPYHVY